MWNKLFMIVIGQNVSLVIFFFFFFFLGGGGGELFVDSVFELKDYFSPKSFLGYQCG